MPLPLTSLVFFLSFLGVSFFAPTLAAASQPIVDLGYAQYQGTFNTSTNTTQFLGVRFAAPPTGTQRWRLPQVPQHTPGVQLANAQPAPCFSAGQGESATAPGLTARGFGRSLARRSALERRALGPSEDCLFLNVWTPEVLPTKTRLPVVVWIHGGGYVAGSASGFSGPDFFDGNDLIRESNREVVVVVIQYRLGLFGFLPGAKVKEGGTLNAGLWDQHFAFQWVQEHISKFGGDASQVTIWGESAGAGSVLQHVVAQGGKTNPPLFRAAITSSSFLPSQYAFNDDVPETLFSEVVAQTNCSSAADALACLRTVDPGVLETANVNINSAGFFGTFVFVPVVDGVFITQRPTESLQQGKVNGEVLYSVTNTFEGALFVDPSIANTVNVSTYVAQLFTKFGPEQIAETARQYAPVGTPFQQVIGIMGESIFICPTYFLLKAFNGRSFKGEFAIPPGGHGSDVVYYWPSMPGGPPFANPTFDLAFAQSFLAVARFLAPGVHVLPGDITPAWAHWAAGHTEMLFNRTDAGAPVVHTVTTDNALLERCAFWESVSALTAQ